MEGPMRKMCRMCVPHTRTKYLLTIPTGGTSPSRVLFKHSRSIHTRTSARKYFISQSCFYSSDSTVPTIDVTKKVIDEASGKEKFTTCRSNEEFAQILPSSEESSAKTNVLKKTEIMHEGRGGDAPYPKAANAKELFELVWADYKFTWEGFFDQYKLNKKENDTKEEKLQEISEPMISTEKLIQQKKKLRKNVDNNVEKLQESGEIMVNEMKNITGIRNQQDLKKWAMEQLKLANECVAEFMQGYRKGRDQEVDKMMNEYFKDINFDDEEEGDNEKEVKENEDKVVKKSGRRRKNKLYN